MCGHPSSASAIARGHTGALAASTTAGTAASSFAGVENAIGILAEPKRSPDRGRRFYVTPAWRYQFIRCCRRVPPAHTSP